jgi:hypothetical protein
MNGEKFRITQTKSRCKGKNPKKISKSQFLMQQNQNFCVARVEIVISLAEVSFYPTGFDLFRIISFYF